MSSPSLHPQNDRVGDEGILFPPGRQYRFPPVYIARGGSVKHETPLCPELDGQPFHMVCREDALYTCGERRCETCRSYQTDLDHKDTGWTDPRYRRGDEPDE